MASENGGTGSAGPRDHVYPQAEEAVLGQVRDALKQIEYGSILIKIHQGEVVGIETSTKLRLRTPQG